MKTKKVPIIKVSFLKSIPTDILKTEYLKRANKEMIDSVLNQELSITLKKGQRIFFFTDTHFPYHLENIFDYFTAIVKKHNITKNDIIICGGDEVDLACLSFHPKNPKMFSSSDELHLSAHYLKVLYKMFPNMLLCYSNHGSLVYRKAAWAGMNDDLVKDLNTIWGVGKGWKWADRIFITMANGKKMMFIHNLTQNIENNIIARGISIIQGHFHSKLGIIFRMLEGGKHIFGINGGCLANQKHPAFSYAKYQKDKWQHGSFLIEESGVTFIEYKIDSNNNWTGQL